MRMTCRVLCILGTVLLCGGCSTAEVGLQRDALLAAATAPFSFTGTATVEGLSQPVKLKATKGAERLTIELLEPEAVQGLTVEFGETGPKVTFHGLVMELAPGDIPTQSLFVELRAVLAAVPDETTQLTQREGLVTLAGKAGMLPYEQLWTADGASLKAIRLPASGGIIAVESFQKEP